ncbi:hypothetical protein BOQ63_006775 (plasmid) [Streptomyces viridifaciens]|uniref:hypothetical protein n=1 Tax=Kitasatospora aureofaciens TaxID=1894 RepID=UPI000AF077F1|nr:hypothetical protein BOQ63_006775 [Streptomyces viridifaciens]
MQQLGRARRPDLGRPILDVGGLDVGGLDGSGLLVGSTSSSTPTTACPCSP